MSWRDILLGREETCPHRRVGKYCPDCGMLLEVPRYSLDEILGKQSKV